MPATLNVAVVSMALALPNVTVPGPETVVQLVVSEPPTGRPSSVTVPFKAAPAAS